MLKLAYGEEAARCKLTWQMLDRRIWDLAFGGTEVLKKYFVKPEDAIGNLEHAVIGFSDQVPWWGMMKQGKQLYMKHEHNKAAAKTAGEPSQKRGWDDDQASKLRIVVELRQIVKGWSGSGVPTGSLQTAWSLCLEYMLASPMPVTMAVGSRLNDSRLARRRW